MSDITNYFRHLPSIIEVQKLDVDNIEGSACCSFVRLKVAGNDLWVKGTPVWHNRMSLPDCLITITKHLSEGTDSSSINSRLFEISSRQSIIEDDVRKVSSSVDRLVTGNKTDRL